MDYELLTDTMRAGMTFAEYIDLFDTLSLDMYYRTDTHWRQETLGETGGGDRRGDGRFASGGI